MEQAQQKKVMIFGTFDLLHAGHENMFRQARELGDYLVAIIARDDTVKKIKGEYPHYTERQRVKNIKNTNLIDKVILGNHGDKYEILRKIRPDVIALGYDQFAFTYQLEKFLIDEKINAEIIRLKAYKPEMYKSSIIRATMMDKNRSHGDLGNNYENREEEDAGNTNDSADSIDTAIISETAFTPHM